MAFSQVKFAFDNFATGFQKPVDIAHCGDSRLFIVEQRGYIWVLDSLGNKQTDPFLNIDPRVNSNGNEQGLLGLAFHPNFAQNGWFFVNYTQANGDTRVSRFTLMPGSNSIADPNSELIMMEIDQPYSNHNGGCIKFGTDGYLYISLGDGGSGGDPQGNGQKKTTYLGKMLRIDVNADVAPYYTVPDSNPFVGQSDYLPEIWSLGLRNVWRFSFDRLTGDMWMGDVGQNEYEEIHFEPTNTGGRNYGWRCYEGTHPYNTNGCQPASNYVEPVFEYSHSTGGCSVTGGFVYRGTKYPLLYGRYVFADYCNGRMYVVTPDGNGGFSTLSITNNVSFEYSSFGEDYNGELYVTAHSTGKIMKLRELCSNMQVTSTVTNTCPGQNQGSISLTTTGSTGTVLYAWTGGASGANQTGLAAGTYTVWVRDANLCEVRDTFVITNLSDLQAATISFASGDSILCPGETTILQANGTTGPNISYQWHQDGLPISGANATTLDVSTLGAGDYAVAIVDVTVNCPPILSAAQSVDLSISIGDVLLYENGVLRLQFASGTGTGTFQWFLNNQPIAGATGPTFTPDQNGVYSVQYTPLDGCLSEYAFTVRANEIAGIRSASVSPNPSDGLFVLNMALEQHKDLQLKVYSIKGEMLLDMNVSGQQINTPLNLKAWPSGTYTLSLTDGSGVWARQLVKQ